MNITAPNFVPQALIRFKQWNTPKLTRLERHEGLKAFLFEFAKSGSPERIMLYINPKGKEVRGRIDFVSDDCAVEIDHSMKSRSLLKLQKALEEGLSAVWIILRPTASYPRKFGRIKRKAETLGIKVIILRGLARG